jgi:hypothetical protein
MDGRRTRLFGAVALAVFAVAPARGHLDGAEYDCAQIDVRSERQGNNVVRFTVRCTDDVWLYTREDVPESLFIDVVASPASERPFIVSLVRGPSCRAKIQRNGVFMNCGFPRLLTETEGVLFDVCFPPGESVWADISVKANASGIRRPAGHKVSLLES